MAFPCAHPVVRLAQQIRLTTTRNPCGTISRKHHHHMRATAIRSTGGTGLQLRRPGGRAPLTIGERLLELTVGYHTAPIFIDPTKSRAVQLAIKSAQKAQTFNPSDHHPTQVLAYSFPWTLRFALLEPLNPSSACHLPKAKMLLPKEAKSFLHSFPFSGLSL